MRVVFILFLSLDCNPGQALGVLLPFYVCVCVLIMCTSTECSSHRCTPFTLLGLNIILLRAAATCEGESTGLARTIYVLYLYNIYTVHIRFFWQGNYQTYGHIRCIYIWLWPTLRKYVQSREGGWGVTRMAYSRRLWLMAIGWWNKINQCRKLKLNPTHTWGGQISSNLSPVNLHSFIDLIAEIGHQPTRLTN